MTDELLTIPEIAQMLKITEHAAREVVRKPGFPPPAPISTERRRRWIASEVRKYAFKRVTVGPVAEQRAA